VLTLKLCLVRLNKLKLNKQTEIMIDLLDDLILYFEARNTGDVTNGFLKRCKQERNQALNIDGVSNWVAIESPEQPEIMTDVMVKYKDGRKEVAFFDGDNRFYIEKDDRDITETIIEWHRLP
jgi:hypothetical protein